MSRDTTPLPWRVTRDNEIVSANGNTVAWGYHEDFGALLSKIKRIDAHTIVYAVNKLG